MNDYKASLNLPQTDFPMKAGLPECEPEMLKHWQTMDLYGQLRNIRQGAPKYILHDGPPYANGEIHIGHAVNKILKDIIVKARGFSGFDAPYVPGWDCHGLPIELMVEKKLGKAGRQVEPAVFRQACRDYAAAQVDKQRADFQRLGVLGDWEHPYLTMNYVTEANIIRALGTIIERGHLQKGEKPVHWCIDCGSALAEAEVEYEDKDSPAIDVRFPVADEAQFLSRIQHTHSRQGPIAAVIWTTTPWTLPANQAVALNPDEEYSLVQCEGNQGAEQLVIATALLKDVMSRYGIDQYHVVGYAKGADLEGVMLKHPFYAREVPIIAGEHVTLDTGTGAVHTAPAHGQDDYVVGSRYNLPVDNPVADNGCFYPEVELFGGQHVFKANAEVIEVLKARGMLVHQARLKHSYPHCWRHKTPVIFRATPQWFISMENHGLRAETLAQIGQVIWLPEWGEQRIYGMVENRPDWCISRQRTWGVPIPLFVHKKSGALHPQTKELIEAVAERVEQGGIDAWFSLDPVDLLGEDAGHYDKVMDTLDVWFDSGVTHATVLETNPALGFPADLYLEGSDQHRGWFQSSLLSSVAMRGLAPYRTVLTHGFTVDAQGMKMSKSRGNVVAPQKVMSSLGADILRLWVAATDYRAEMAVSDEILKRTADAYRRIRNTARFLLANLSGFDPVTDIVPAEQMVLLDRWAVDQAAQLQQEILEAYDNFQFHLIYQRLQHFCSITLGSFYLDVIKDRQYTTPRDSRPRRSAQTAIYHIAEALVRLVAPIMSFTADEIWRYLPGQRSESVFLEVWYTPLARLDQAAAVDWDKLMEVRAVVSKELERLRVVGEIGSSLDAEIDMYCDPSRLQTSLSAFKDELRFLFITSYARLHELSEAPADALDAGEFKLVVRASEHEKCVRCWHHREDVGRIPEHLTICGRCVKNLGSEGEVRLYA